MQTTDPVPGPTERSHSNRRLHFGTIKIRDLFFLLILGLPTGLLGEGADTGPLGERAGEFAEKFDPKGAQADGSPLPSATQSLKNFQLRDGVVVELVASEPEVAQPLHMTFDFKGRLWVVQYLQYQFPAGLKIVRYDQYLRAVYDKVPEPPPHGPKGADKITVYEDRDGDGTFESKKDIVTGLNMATAVLPGHKGFWVLQPPYLLHYADENGDDVPDADPVVHLSGFGLEDTHSLANSLRWGPDGWIYGANGSTTTASVKTLTGKATEWKGQCIWRYHPKTWAFEIYAEGGGNTFSLEIDSAGRVFSGTNGGNTRGMHYEQGSYGVKNWGKHGALTNPYAFGFFEHMKHEGDNRRFAQAFAIYEGGGFGGMLDGRIIAPNALHNIVWTSRLEPEKSTFRTVDEEPLIKADDRWFRPVDVKIGPDGAIYIADWTDSRLSHVSPVDDWDKGSGRIYRVRPKEGWEASRPFDLTKMDTAGLLVLLGHENKWFRRAAVLQLGWREGREMASEMVKLAQREKGQKAVEAVWVVHLLGALENDVAIELLDHESPAVRRVVLRLLGDRKGLGAEVKPGEFDAGGGILNRLIKLARVEVHPEVRAQLAATARRLHPTAGISVLWELAGMNRGDDSRMSLLTWWGLEENEDGVRAMLGADILDLDVLFETERQSGIVEKLARRWSGEGGTENYSACLLLLESAPDAESRSGVLDGIMDGFGGQLPADVPDVLSELIQKASEESGGALVLGVRNRDEKAIAEAIRAIGDGGKPMRERLKLAEALGKSGPESAVKPLLATLRPSGQHALKRTAMRALAGYEYEYIAVNILQLWQNSLPDEHGLRETAQRVLAGRKGWARLLFEEVNSWRIFPSAIQPDVLQLAARYGDEEIDALIAKNWPDFEGATTATKIAKMKRVREALASGKPGDPGRGGQIFSARCASCHQLFGKGTAVGPDLTGYERGNIEFWLPAIIDPSLELREGFVTHMAETKDGRTLVGFIADRGSKSVALRDPSGQLTELLEGELKSLTALKTSLMPEGLLDGVGDGELRDLFSYLMRDE